MYFRVEVLYRQTIGAESSPFNRLFLVVIGARNLVERSLL